MEDLLSKWIKRRRVEYYKVLLCLPANPASTYDSNLVLTYERLIQGPFENVNSTLFGMIYAAGDRTYQIGIIVNGVTYQMPLPR